MNYVKPLISSKEKLYGKSWNYVLENLDAYKIKLNQGAMELLSKWWFALLIPTVMILLNLFKTKDGLNLVAVYTTIPVAISTFVPYLVIKYSSNLGFRLYKYGRFVLDIIFFSGFASMALYNGIIAAGEIHPLKDGPFQVGLLLLAIHSYHISFRYIAIRNILMAIFGFIIVYMLSPSFAQSAVGQFVGGLVFSLLYSYIIMRLQVINFYRIQDSEDENSHYYQQHKLALYPHQQMMLKLRHNLVDTMPTNARFGIVGDFDIQDSTDQGKTKGYGLLKQQAFKSCYEHLMSEYCINTNDQKSPYSLAYKLKELGDAFIFTVNYPFKLKQGMNQNDVAVDLSLQFFNLFDSTFANFSHEVFCAATLCEENLRGFWTQPPAVAYDLNQECVNRCSRLAATRRVFQDKLAIQGCHILIITEGIYQGLSPFYKQQFTAVGLEEHKVVIRNFESIGSLYIASVGANKSYQSASAA